MFKFDVAFIVDFYLPKYKTVIEIDGEYHFEETQESYDLYREKYLIQKRNFALIRISNNYLKLKTDQEMITILNETLEKIKRSDKIIFY